MNSSSAIFCTVFVGDRLLSAGALREVALAVKQASHDHATNEPVLVFNDATGEVIDLDLRGSDAEVIARLPLSQSAPPAAADPAPRGRGRPKLGVVAREVTLLPRHWDWLATQPGGASVALRKLVELARRSDRPEQHARAAQERAYRFISAIAGNQPGFEEATRALFANERTTFERHMDAWPRDVKAYVLQLAYGD